MFGRIDQLEETLPKKGKGWEPAWKDSEALVNWVRQIQ